MILIGDEEFEGALAVGHLTAAGQVDAYDSFASAFQAAALFGGKVMQRAIYTGPWMPVADDLQPQWVIPE